MDLYAYHPDRAKLIRLTDLERAEDSLNFTAAEKDSRQKRYVPPQGGIEGFDLSDDGSNAIFVLKGDLYVVKTDGSGAELPAHAHQSRRVFSAALARWQ